MTSVLTKPAVFISHSSINREMASTVKAELIAHGISCWMAPDDIALGQTWEDAIAEAISVAAVFVLIWSSRSQTSSQVKRELSLAASQQKLIIPLKLDDSDPSGAFAYYLTNTHWMQLTPATIEKCCTSIGEQARSTQLIQQRSLLNEKIADVRIHSSERQHFGGEPHADLASLDVVHEVYVSALQARQGHTRVMKIGIGNMAESLDVKVPPGVKSGVRLRLKGKGDRHATTGHRGDLYLIIRVVSD
jgi:hypothetical protein